MKSKILAPLMLCLSLAGGAALAAGAAVGQSAPLFSATDPSGKVVSLADFKGKTVVLEWVNPECPYVRKHYDSTNMQATQRAATAKDVVWLSVNSTHPSHVDYKKPAEMAAWTNSPGAAPSSHADGRRWQDRPQPTAHAPRRTCTWSTPRARWSTPAASTTSRARTRPT